MAPIQSPADTCQPISKRSLVLLDTEDHQWDPPWIQVTQHRIMQRGGPTEVTWAPPLTLPLPAKAPPVWCLTPPHKASMGGETGPPNMGTADWPHYLAWFKGFLCASKKLFPSQE